jgi:ATP-dependent exoDNAse (exonuclease V) beta subunit
LVDHEFQQVKQEELINFLVNCDIDSSNQNDMISKKTSLPKSTLKDLQKNNSQIGFFNKFLPKIVHNSNENNIQNISKIKGILIHKILEVIGKNYKKPISVINNYCLKLIENTSFLDLKSKKEITNMINDFLTSSHYHQIFSGEIKCEAEVNYMNNFARIDLINFNEKIITIIDYKSDELIPNEIPNQYQEQLKKYCYILKNLYPNHQINCAILWIKHLKINYFKN